MYYKYIYNSSDELTGYAVNNGTDYINIYYYLKNAQGDITAVVNSFCKKIVSFNYDVFGKMTIEVNLEAPQPPEDSEPSSMISHLIQQIFHTLAVTAATSTPFAYRDYCYDQYTGLYYLQSRYYDPEIGRFINADDTTYLNATGTVLGCNLFVYCENDPVNNVDPKGTLAQWVIGTTISGLIAFVTYYAEYYLGMRRWNVYTLVAIVAFNAAIGAFTWYWGVGGKIQNIKKLGGVLQNLKIVNNGIVKLFKIIKWVTKGVKTIVNMLIKKFTRYSGESWYTAIKRFFGKTTGVYL